MVVAALVPNASVGGGHAEPAAARAAAAPLAARPPPPAEALPPPAPAGEPPGPLPPAAPDPFDEEGGSGDLGTEVRTGPGVVHKRSVATSTYHPVLEGARRLWRRGAVRLPKAAPGQTPLGRLCKVHVDLVAAAASPANVTDYLRTPETVGSPECGSLHLVDWGGGEAERQPLHSVLLRTSTGWGAVQQAARTVANVAAFARWRGAAQLVAVYASSDTPQPHNGFFTKVLGTRDAFSVHRAVRMVVYLDLDQWFSALAFEMPPTELGGFGEQLFPVLLPVRRRWQWAMQDDHPYEHLCAGFFVARRGAFARRMLSDWWEAAEQLPRRGHWAARKVGCCTGLHPGDQGCLHHALFGHMARYNNLSYTAVCLTQGKGQAPNWMFPDSQGPVFHRGGMPVRKIKVGAQANNHVNLRKVLSRSGIRQGVSNFSWGEIYFVPPRIGPGVRAKLSHALWSTTEPLPHVLLHTGGSRARPGVGYLERIFIPPHRYDNGTGQAQLLWERELAEVARLWKEELSQPAPPKRGVRIKNPKGFLASRLGRRR
eukprot:TRINITY_DN474_c0_g1_i3.p1 TRINITY_DN474_c0_g1~~TRINITY_DN474_c0_g1_i3.p1  ORF type:complete len:594 (+),score=167.82 TRINITY_DN474_c0_g1_i3:162-1784(+)